MAFVRQPLTLNRYIYAVNNPVNYLDPTVKKAMVAPSGGAVIIVEPGHGSNPKAPNLNEDPDVAQLMAYGFSKEAIEYYGVAMLREAQKKGVAWDVIRSANEKAYTERQRGRRFQELYQGEQVEDPLFRELASHWLSSAASSVWQFTDKVFGFSHIGKACGGIFSWDCFKAVGATTLKVGGAVAVVAAGTVVVPVVATGGLAGLGVAVTTSGTVAASTAVLTAGAAGALYSGGLAYVEGLRGSDLAAVTVEGGLYSAGTEGLFIAGMAGAQRFSQWREGRSEPSQAGSQIETEAQLTSGPGMELQLFADKGNRTLDPNHHNANVRVIDSNGQTIYRGRFVSGNMTEEEIAMGFPKGMLASHTEARAVRQVPLQKGQTMIITGQRAPCPSCKGYMNQAARNSGATIIYQWRQDGRTMRWTATPFEN